LSQEYEFAYKLSVLLGKVRTTVPIVPYIPTRRQPPQRSLNVVSAWEGNQNILADLIERFHIDTKRCLEFGVEYGFSAVALSSFFASVTGVDTFHGDQHTINKDDIFDETVRRLSPYSNIELIRSDYRDFIKQEHGTYGLIHVDIIHTYADTFACGLWSARHSDCTIFHDTNSFAPVR